MVKFDSIRAPKGESPLAAISAIASILIALTYLTVKADDPGTLWWNGIKSYATLLAIILLWLIGLLLIRLFRQHNLGCAEALKISNRMIHVQGGKSFGRFSVTHFKDGSCEVQDRHLENVLGETEESILRFVELHGLWDARTRLNHAREHASEQLQIARQQGRVFD